METKTKEYLLEHLREIRMKLMDFSISIKQSAMEALEKVSNLEQSIKNDEIYYKDED